MHLAKRLLITPGEPAGVGPDITIQLAQQAWPAELIAVADPDMLRERAKALQLPLTLLHVDVDSPPQETHKPGMLKVWPVKLNDVVVAGKGNRANADYVLRTLALAANACLEKKADAIVTGPVNKQIIN